tara:strand:- start:112 stop:375 length:264 start_codon:yes stop_codon:yes gene_type:complete
MDFEKLIILFENVEKGKIIEKIENVCLPQQLKYRTIAKYCGKKHSSKYQITIEGENMLNEFKEDMEHFLLSELVDELEIENVTFKWE